MRGKSSALRAKEEFLALYHDGAFEAGTKIPSESSMAEMLGVSRETWRKALGLLRGEGVLPTFFEICTAVAFEFFAEENVDYAVIEVGLGGRRDSTNVITPMVSVIASIGFDHMKTLGSTLPEIAGEKALRRG